MEHIFKDLLNNRPWRWLCLFGAVIALAIACVPYWTKGVQWWLLFFSYFTACLFLAPAVFEAARKDHQHILTVGVWSLVMVVVGCGFVFYSFMYTLGGNAAFEKILTVVPVMFAIWAAAVGWFVHFKLTQKAHRTNNAFAIIMETRKSAEFRTRADLVAKHFPPGTDSIPREYAEFFCPQRLGEALRGEDQALKERAEAILALKYILNYYEFMAVGVRVGDLEEKMIFDTIHPTVCNLYDRSSSLIAHLRDTRNRGSDRSTYCDLEKLVDRWKKWKKDQE
jgi:hypothetical protein